MKKKDREKLRQMQLKEIDILLEEKLKELKKMETELRRGLNERRGYTQPIPGKTSDRGLHIEATKKQIAVMETIKGEIMCNMRSADK